MVQSLGVRLSLSYALRWVPAESFAVAVSVDCRRGWGLGWGIFCVPRRVVSIDWGHDYRTGWRLLEWDLSRDVYRLEMDTDRRAEKAPLEG